MFDPRARNGETVPAWRDVPDPALIRHSSAIERTSADVLVVGAGIAGLSVAYHALAAGRSVIVVDRGRVGAGETARSSAHLSDALDDRYSFLEQAHGKDGARIAAQSHRAGIESIAQIAAREGIACDFERVPGYLFAEDAKGVETLERECAAAERAGLSVALVARAPASFESRAALRFDDQAQIDPRAYLLGLAAAVVRRGGALYTERAIAEIDEKDGIVARLATGETITANSLVVATNAPVKDNLSLHLKQAPYRSYVIGIELEQSALERALFWDLADPYHYLRWLDSHVLLVGGEDHRVGHTADPEARFAALERWARERFPHAGRVRSRWSGQVLEPADGLAFIGRSTGASPNSYVVTGDSGNGLTHGALAGLLIADLLEGKENPWARVYDPGRSCVHNASSLLSFARDSATVALSYTDWVVPGAAGDVALSPGEGCIVQDGLHKLAVSVDDAGVRHVCSAVCPHLYAVVRWNPLEKSWDCPAHGSRFAVDGRPLNGPTSGGLERAGGDDMATTKSATKSATTPRKTASKKRATKRAAPSAAKKKTRAKAPKKNAKAAPRKYGPAAAKKVAEALHEQKEGTLRSGRSKKKVTSRAQAIAIGLSEARKRGAKVPKKAS